MGGLGNQLFQWAYGKSLSNIYDLEFLLDESFYLEQSKVTPRKFNLDLFPNIKYSKIDSEINYHFFEKVTDSQFPNIKKLEKNKNYLLEGYFQSESYFFPVADLIRKELSVSKEKEEEFRNKYDLTNSTSIHIRRTDYLTSGGFHPILPLSYYSKALSFLKSKNVFVFSDDIQWCKENLEFDNLCFIENSNNYEDLWLMSLCDNNIIANSSFSWWAAWLNRNKNKKVISPKIWFNGMSNNFMIPNDWISI